MANPKGVLIYPFGIVMLLSLKEKKMKAILIRLLKFIKRERFIESEYCNSDKDLNLNKKTLSKLVRSNVISCDISSDFTTIVCFCGKKGKLKFLKMRKYIKAEPNHLEVCELAKNYCIPQ